MLEQLKHYLFQFPLWDTEIDEFLRNMDKQGKNFQFPLWDTDREIIEARELPEIPFQFPLWDTI